MVGRIAKGIVAGVAGTLAMDVFWWRRARREGRRHRFIDFEFTTGDTYETFDDAPAPAKVAAKMAGIVGVELPKAAGGLANDIVHWGTGLSWGAFAGLLVGDDLMHPLTAGVLAGATAYRFPSRFWARPGSTSQSGSMTFRLWGSTPPHISRSARAPGAPFGCCENSHLDL